MTTAEKLVKIAENEPKVYEAGRKEGMSFVADNVGNALKGSASGEAVALKDVSPIEHNLGVRVESKNLAVNVWSAHDCNTILENGIVTQIEADTYETVYLKAQVYQDTTLISDADILSITSIGIHSISFTKATAGNTLVFGLNGRERDTIIRIDITDLPEGVYTVSANFTNLTQGSISWCDIMLNRDTEVKPYTPPISDLSAVKLKVQGGNILDFDLCVGDGLEKIGDNTYRLSWKINQWGYETRFSTKVPFVVPVNTKLVFSYELVEKSLHHNIGDDIEMYVRLLDKSYGEAGAANVINGVGAFEATQEHATFDICLLSLGQIGDYVIFKNPQLKIGTTATEYEPYKEPIEYAQGEDIKSIYPSTTLMTDTEGAIMTVEYNRDINVAFAELLQKISSLGG